MALLVLEAATIYWQFDRCGKAGRQGM